MPFRVKRNLTVLTDCSQLGLIHFSGREQDRGGRRP